MLFTTSLLIARRRAMGGCRQRLAERGRRLRLDLALALASVLAGCGTPPPLVLETPRGTVRGSTWEEVDEVAARLVECQRGIRALLPHTRDTRVTVWVEEDLEMGPFRDTPKTMEGWVDRSRRRIHVRSGGACRAQTLCHELVHVLLDVSWKPLPALVEEGLCESVATRIVGGCGRVERGNGLLGAALYLGDVRAEARLRYEAPGKAARFLRVPAVFERKYEGSLLPRRALDLSGAAETLARDSRIHPGHYGFGLWLVERIAERHGYEGLYELCDRARREGRRRVPGEWVLAAAEAGPEESWKRSILESLEKEDLRRILRQSREDLACEVATWLARVSEGEGDIDAILDRTGVSFHFEAHDREVSLLETEGFRDDLRRCLAEMRGQNFEATESGFSTTMSRIGQEASTRKTK